MLALPLFDCFAWAYFIPIKCCWARLTADIAFPFLRYQLVQYLNGATQLVALTPELRERIP